MKLVEGIREEIRRLGGEIRFEERVTDITIEGEGDDRHVTALQILKQATGESYTLQTNHVVMALGHSSRDTFTMFYERGVYMEAKPFSVGFRIEHPQSVIDKARWGKNAGHPCWARPTTSWCTTPRMAVRSIASVCAPAAPWSRPPASLSAWSPMA